MPAGRARSNTSYRVGGYVMFEARSGASIRQEFRRFEKGRMHNKQCSVGSIRAVVTESPDCTIEHGPQVLLQFRRDRLSAALKAVYSQQQSVLVLLKRLLRPCNAICQVAILRWAVLVAGDHTMNERQCAVKSFSCPSDCRMHAVAMQCLMLLFCSCADVNGL